MRSAVLAPILLVLAAPAAPAMAADPPPIAPPVGAPPGMKAAETPAPAKPATGNTVSPVTVFPATAAPKLAKTYPAAGQALSSGILVLTVTFDQPMQATGFDYSAAAGGEAPPCLKTPRLLDDKKTFVLLCTTEPAKNYALAFNAQAQAAQGTQGGFRNTADHRADPATLSFKTTDGRDGPNDIHEAMKAAGLRGPLDMPIEISPDRHGDAAAPAKP